MTNEPNYYSISWILEVLRWANVAVDQPLTKAIGAVLLAYVIAWFGLRSYFQQRRADRARLRFVEEGIDDFAAQLDSLLSVQRHNWQMMLRYLKLVRDAAATVIPEEFFRSLREIDSKTFNIVSAHRVTDLLGEKLFWIGYQKVYSFVGTKADFIYGDFGSALRSLTANPNNPKKDEFIQEAGRIAGEMGDTVEPLYVFVSEVANIAALADANIFDRKAAEVFKKRMDVKEIVGRLKKRFPEWTTDPNDVKSAA